MRNSIPIRRAPAVTLVVLAFSVHVALAQENGAPQPAQTQQTPQTPGTGQQPGGGQQGRGQVPGQTQQRQQQNVEPYSAPIYLSGQVRLADGTIPPDRVVIERVCPGYIRPEAYTDSKGNFSFQVGDRNSGVFMDASVAGDSNPFGGGRGVNPQELSGCEIRASLPGFQSDSVILGFRRSLDNPDVGIIHLHPLANVQGYTFSGTTALAPKDARKAYESASGKMKKEKWAEAEKELTKAVASYPKYAVAWFDLGRAYQRQKKLDDAIHAYQQAIQADSKFINPYGQLAALAVFQEKWDDAAQYASRMLKLNPYMSADVYFYSAVANYKLGNAEVAEEHARQAAKIDAQHKIAKIQHLLGIILLEKQEYAGASENLRLYLKLTPNAPEANEIRSELSEMDKRLAERR